MGLERLLSSPNPPLLAHLEGLAARLAGTARGALYGDSSLWAMQVRNAGQVIGCRTGMLGCTPLLAAEALGSCIEWEGGRVLTGPSPPVVRRHPTAYWTSLLGALEQLTADPARGPVVARLPGPALLAHLWGVACDESFLAALKPEFMSLVVGLCQRRPDLLIIQEHPAEQSAQLSLAHRRLLITVRNVARHYDVSLGIGVGSAGSAATEAYARTQPEALLLDASRDLPSPETIRSWLASVRLVGVAIELTDTSGALHRVEEARRALPRGRWLACTASELPTTAELANVRELVSELRLS